MSVIYIIQHTFPKMKSLRIPKAPTLMRAEPKDVRYSRRVEVIKSNQGIRVELQDGSGRKVKYNKQVSMYFSNVVD